MRTAALSLLSFSMLAAGAAESGMNSLKEAVSAGRMPKVINESSGVIKSRRYAGKGIFWTHNDSGDSARIFAINGKGEMLREATIPNAKNRDWEEISMDEKGRIVICDIGDNAKVHKRFTLYRIPEPDALDPKDPAAAADVFRYRYPDGEGPFDAEGLFVRDGYAYIFTKEQTCVRFYRLPLPEIPPASEEPVVAERLAVTKTMLMVTGAAITDDGRHIALINYFTVVVIDLPEPFEKIAKSAAGAGSILDLPRRTRTQFLGQTEGVCWDANDLFLTTESGVDLHMPNTWGFVYRLPDVLPAPK